MWRELLYIYSNALPSIEVSHYFEKFARNLSQKYKYVYFANDDLVAIYHINLFITLFSLLDKWIKKYICTKFIMYHAYLIIVSYLLLYVFITIFFLHPRVRYTLENIHAILFISWGLFIYLCFFTILVSNFLSVCIINEDACVHNPRC